YMSRKTQKSKNEIVELMDKTTWMTAADAVEMGFADEVEGAQQISASMAGSVLNIAGLSFDLSCFETLPSFINSVPAAAATPEPQNSTTNKEEKKLPDINNLEELRKEYPDLVNQLVNESVSNALKQEKDRLTALDALNDTQNPAIAELIQEAKNSGKTADDIKGVVDILKKHPPAAAPAQNKGQEFLIAAINGNKQSGVENIQTDAAGAATEAQELAAAVNYMAQGLNQKAGKDGK
ncbi:MAG: ATP-dependent Clp protease proteolytic subunit, partial [Sporomusa sp.]